MSNNEKMGYDKPKEDSMKRLVSLLVIGIVVASLALTGCEKKSDAEKALDSMKQDANSLLK
jgi:hypothetical protein